MHVIDHIRRYQQKKKVLISFEVLPPLRGQSIDTLYRILDPLMEFSPPFINVTYHRAEYILKKKPDGSLERIAVRKRPGTVGICAAIKYKYGVDPVPHLICGGFTKVETEDALFDLHYLGIDNVLCVRGDPARHERYFVPEPEGHRYAVELVRQVVNLNRGIFLEGEVKNGFHTNFCIGVAGYPEKHYEAPNMEVDLQHLKEKVEAGAHYIVTQMFFDNRHFFRFVERCRQIGITCPIIPGIKPITKKKQLITIPRTFHVEIPIELYREVEKAKSDEDARQIGIEWTVAQCRELIARGVPALHFFTMSDPDPIIEILRRLL